LQCIDLLPLITYNFDVISLVQGRVHLLPIKLSSLGGESAIRHQHLVVLLPTQYISAGI